jgi:CheY-like chemotaxis protein
MAEAGGDHGSPRILVVEDEALVAADLAATLEARGWRVVGPFARLRDALAWLAADRPDAALLDVNVAGEMVVPVADRLAALGVPYAFVTGYSDPPWERHGHAPVLHKPSARARVQEAVDRLLAGAGG